MESRITSTAVKFLWSCALNSFWSMNHLSTVFELFPMSDSPVINRRIFYGRRWMVNQWFVITFVAFFHAHRLKMFAVLRHLLFCALCAVLSARWVDEERTAMTELSCIMCRKFSSVKSPVKVVQEVWSCRPSDSFKTHDLSLQLPIKRMPAFWPWTQKKKLQIDTKPIA